MPKFHQIICALTNFVNIHYTFFANAWNTLLAYGHSNYKERFTLNFIYKQVPRVAFQLLCYLRNETFDVAGVHKRFIWRKLMSLQKLSIITLRLFYGSTQISSRKKKLGEKCEKSRIYMKESWNKYIHSWKTFFRFCGEQTSDLTQYRYSRWATEVR